MIVIRLAELLWFAAGALGCMSGAFVLGSYLARRRARSALTARPGDESVEARLARLEEAQAEAAREMKQIATAQRFTVRLLEGRKSRRLPPALGNSTPH